MTTDAPPGRRREEPWMLALGLVSVAVSLVVRVLDRGPYIPGCDLIAPTVGHFLASTRSFPDVLREVWWQNRHYFLPFPTYSAPFVIVPGYLEMLWPWRYWVHVLVLVTFVLMLLLILRATDLRLRSAGILLLGWGASPMLLTYAVVGEPWGTAFLATAIALWVTMSRRLRRRPLLTLLCALLAAEMGWHVYELGKPVGVVFLAGVFLLRDVPLVTRAIWLLVGAGQLADALVYHRTLNINAFAYQQGSPWAAVGASAAVVVNGIHGFGTRLLALDLDLPILLAVALASFLFFRRDRLFLLALFLFQLGLQVLLAAYGAENLRPRRYMMVDGYALVCLASMYREAGPLPRRVLIGVLLLGNLWQAAELRRFVRTPRAPVSFTMPFMKSEEGVGFVDAFGVDAAEDMIRRAEAGERLLVVYNFKCYTENFTNPLGVLEHVYLALGHDRFVQSVLTYASDPCRYDCLPFRPPADFYTLLDGIHADGPTPPATLTGYYSTICKIQQTPDEEVEAMWQALDERFVLKKEQLPGDEWLRFKILGRRPATGRGSLPPKPEAQVDERP